MSDNEQIPNFSLIIINRIICNLNTPSSTSIYVIWTEFVTNVVNPIETKASLSHVAVPDNMAQQQPTTAHNDDGH